jgi:antitoxin YefM
MQYMREPQVQYVSDEQGKVQSVIVPIELWREVLSERETAYLLRSETMRQRLLAAIQRQEGIALEDALAQLGI